MTNRIRRSEKPPRFVTDEKVRRRNYPHTLSLGGDDDEVHLRYRLFRWRNLAEDERVQKRELFAWIQIGRRRIGAIELHEFDMSGCFDNDDVLYMMDCEEEYESRLAVVLCSALDDLPWDVMPYGSILDFRHAWIAPDPICRGLFAKAAITIIDTILPDHALMIMKAYPLEKDRFPMARRYRQVSRLVNGPWRGIMENSSTCSNSPILIGKKAGSGTSTQSSKSSS